jgi:hypothetical protein
MRTDSVRIRNHISPNSSDIFGNGIESREVGHMYVAN